MKKIFTLAIATLIYLISHAQPGFNDSVAFARSKLKLYGMEGLGGFAVANIASGLVLANNTHGAVKYFWQMNAYWNFFNLGIAGLGYLGTRKDLLKKYSFGENYTEQQKIEKLYVFNAGLDVAYIATGILLRQKGKIEPDADMRDKLTGYGNSIAVQGGVLLLMDAAMVMLHHKNTVRMGKKLQQIELSAAPGVFAFTYKF